MTEQMKMMLAYTKEKLEGYIHPISSLSMVGYSKYGHTLRVMTWAKRLYENASFKQEVCFDDLMIAAIFHDVGYATADDLEYHARESARLCREYLMREGFPEERIGKIGEMVALHSEKYRMRDPDIDRELLLLMEADLLDDMGAMSIVMDCRIEQAREPQGGFERCAEHIRAYSVRHIAGVNPLVTPYARKKWEEKKALVTEFSKSLDEDMPDEDFLT